MKQLAGKARSELSEPGKTQQQRAAAGLHSVGDQLKAMAERSDQPGVAADVAHQAAEKVHQMAGWLEDRSPLICSRSCGPSPAAVRDVPGGALGAGVVAGRMARGMSSDPATGGNPTAAVSGKAGCSSRGAIGAGGFRPLSGRHARLVVAEPDPFGTEPVRDWTAPSRRRRDIRGEFTDRPARRLSRRPAGGYPADGYPATGYPPQGYQANSSYPPQDFRAVPGTGRRLAAAPQNGPWGRSSAGSPPTCRR